MQKLKAPTSSEIEKVGNLFKIIGDNTRLKLIFSLMDGKKTVSMLSNDVSASQSLISHQLKILKDNNIVGNEKVGNYVYYFLVDYHINILIDICRTHINEEVK